MSASAQWDVSHGLGKFPSVTVTDSAGTEVIGHVQHLTPNRVLLTFSAAFSGVAHFN